MNNRHKITALLPVLLLSAAIVVSGCSSQDKYINKMNENFVTNITEDGSKRFNYSLNARGKRGGAKGADKNRSGGRGGISGGRGGRGDGRGGKGGGQSRQAQSDSEALTKKIQSRMTEQLELYLEQSGYCREGFLELDSYFSPTRSHIRGECRETATDNDRAEFTSQRIKLLDSE